MLLPSWLPERIDTTYSSDKEWERLINQLYTIFNTDFIKHRCHLEGCNIIIDGRKIASPYEEGFWHLVSRDDSRKNNRYFDPERAGRLPWCRPIIENSRDGAVCIWDFLEEDKRVKTYIWLIDLDYLVILEKKKGKKIAILVTAFWIDGDSSRKTLRTKYAKKVI